MTDIKASATAGIYSEVIKQIYDSLDKRIREAVSNAYDANAKNIKFTVYIGRDNKVIIHDDGDGMDESDLVKKYVSLGGGGKYNDMETIGRIGIGALSVFALGDKVTINTRKKGSEEILIAELDFNRVNEANQHSTPLENVKLGEIKGTRKATEDDPDHFTEIIVRDLSRPVIDIFDNERKTKVLIENLEKILPVGYMSDDPILNQPTAITNKLKNEKYLIDVIIHIPHLNYANYKIFRRSIFRVDNTNISWSLPIFPFRLEGGYKTNLTVYGFLYTNEGRAFPKDWQGINVRVKNVSIEANSFFGYIEDQAARVRIGGDLFIENLDENHAIQSNRSGFAYENNDYIIISEYLRPLIRRAIERVRRDSDIDSIIKRIVRQIEKLRNMFEAIMTIQSMKDNANNFKLLDDGDVDNEGVISFSLDEALRVALQDEEMDGEIIWSQTLNTLYYITFEEDDYYSIQLNNRLRDFEFDVAGNTMRCIVGYCGSEKPLLYKKPGELYLNLDNNLIPDRDIMEAEIGFIKAAAILYLNYLRFNDDARELYNATINDLSI